MLQAQQQMLLAQQGRPGGMPGVQGMLPPGAVGMPRPANIPGLPGANIVQMNTAHGLVPFLLQPGQPPVMLMNPAAMPGGGKPGGVAGVPGMMPGMQLPGMAGMPGFPPVQLPRPPGAK